MDSCVLGVVPVCINEKREPLDFRTRELVEIHMYIDQSRAVASAPASSTQTSLRSTIYRQVRPGRLSQFKLQPRHRDRQTQLCQSRSTESASVVKPHLNLLSLRTMATYVTLLDQERVLVPVPFSLDLTDTNADKNSTVDPPPSNGSSSSSTSAPRYEQDSDSLKLTPRTFIWGVSPRLSRVWMRTDEKSNPRRKEWSGTRSHITPSRHGLTPSTSTPPTPKRSRCAGTGSHSTPAWSSRTPNASAWAST